MSESTHLKGKRKENEGLMTDSVLTKKISGISSKFLVYSWKKKR